jgi:hypothetical protein
VDAGSAAGGHAPSYRGGAAPGLTRPVPGPTLARMPLFRRPDGVLCRDLPPVRLIVPYLMRGRNESAVYHEKVYDLTRTRPWLRAYNRSHQDRATLFHLFLTPAPGRCSSALASTASSPAAASTSGGGSPSPSRPRRR